MWHSACCPHRKLSKLTFLVLKVKNSLLIEASLLLSGYFFIYFYFYFFLLRKSSSSPVNIKHNKYWDSNFMFLIWFGNLRSLQGLFKGNFFAVMEPALTVFSVRIRTKVWKIFCIGFLYTRLVSIHCYVERSVSININRNRSVKRNNSNKEINSLLVVGTRPRKVGGTVAQ